MIRARPPFVCPSPFDERAGAGRRQWGMTSKTTALPADTDLTTLANGVRVVTIRMPWLASASASVFVRTGSGHESARLNGISHVVEIGRAHV